MDIPKKHIELEQVNKKFTIDIPFVLFLIGATYVSLAFKILAVVLYGLYLFYRDAKFIKPTKLQLFYLVMIPTGTITPLLRDNFSIKGYWLLWLFGVITWLLGSCISYFIYVSINEFSKATIKKSINVFFLVNIIVSFLQIGYMIFDSGYLVPYWDNNPLGMYGLSTGDHLLGMFGSGSITNAAVSAIGILYFLFSGSYGLAILCLMVLLLCTSNTVLILLTVIIIMILIFSQNPPGIRLKALGLLLVVSIVYPLLTVENLHYVNVVYNETNKPVIKKEVNEATVTDETEIKNIGNYDRNKDYRYAPVSSAAGIIQDVKYSSAMGFLKVKTSGSNHTLEADSLKAYMQRWYGKQARNPVIASFKKPVKLYTYLQTLHFLISDPVCFLFGAGIGNFSSKLAIKATGLNLQGNYPLKYIYLSNPFISYHFFSLLYIYSQPVSEHSVINLPNSIYNQLGGEYGITGVLLFIGLYLLFFIRPLIFFVPGRYLILAAVLLFGFEYWFEMLSFTVVFELLMLTGYYKGGYSASE